RAAATLTGTVAVAVTGTGAVTVTAAVTVTVAVTVTGAVTVTVAGTVAGPLVEAGAGRARGPPAHPRRADRWAAAAPRAAAPRAADTASPSPARSPLVSAAASLLFAHAAPGRSATSIRSSASWALA